MITKFRVWDKNSIKEVKIINYQYQTVIIGDFNAGIERGFDEVEFMQSTGMKDRNGVEIYEGDVVKITKRLGNNRFIGVVEYYGAAFRVRGVKQYSGSEDELNRLYEVIGNKYEHSYLMGDDNNGI